MKGTEPVHTPLKKALFILGSLFVLVFAIEGVFQVFTAKTGAGLAEEMNTEASVKAGFAELFEDKSDTYQAPIPDRFEEEALAVEGRQNYDCDPDNRVIGFWDEHSVNEISSEVRVTLEEKGWNSISSGDASLESWVKSQGTYTWLLVQYVSMEGGTSVVINYQ